jgi:protoporphyrinogen oxidase
MTDPTLILGAGVSGLAAGIASGLTVFEAAELPGGICGSYYVVPESAERLATAPTGDHAYRFERGGGHWLFGGDRTVLSFIAGLVPTARYERRSAVFFPDTGRYAPYPIQNHLRSLDRTSALAALEEMARPQAPAATMAGWLVATFGPTLNSLFFAPFHELYTAGLYTTIAPQDGYKSPQAMALVLRGAFDATPAVGYNTSFLYPQGGLDLLARRMAERATVAYRRRVVQIDVERRWVTFADGSFRPYRTLLSTLPLNQVMALTGLTVGARPDPYTSVLVINLGATRGRACPDDHWLYVPGGG